MCSDEAGDDLEEESVLVTSSGVKMGGTDINTKLERKERRPSVVPEHHVFGLGGEDMVEDKRA